MSKKEELNKTKETAEPMLDDQASRVIEMQGVSGKTITSKVKVFKANKRPSKPDELASEKVEAPVAQTPSVSKSVESERATQKAESVEAKPAQVDVVKTEAEAKADVKPAQPRKISSGRKLESTSEAKVESKPMSEPKPADSSTKKTESPAKPLVDSSAKAKLNAKPVSAPAKAEVETAPAKTSQAEAKPAEKLITAPAPAVATATAERASALSTAPSTSSSTTPNAQKTKPEATNAPQKPKPAEPAKVAPSPAASSGPRKLGNIFDQMKQNQGVSTGRKVEGSGLAATARAFAERQARGEKEGFGGRREGGSRGAYNAGYSNNNGFQRRGPGSGGGFKSARPSDGGFDKDKDDDRPQNRARKAAPKKRPMPGMDLFQGKSSDAGRGFAQRDAIDKRKKSEQYGNKGMMDGGKRKNFSAMDYDQDGDPIYRRGGRRPKREQKATNVAVLTQVSLPESLTVKEFAEALKKTSSDIIKALMKFGVMASLNEQIDYDTCSIIASEFGVQTEKIVEVTEEDILFDDSEDLEENLQARPPVVAVMGHVDHGKTSLLDYIRQSRVASGEAGGITQHIGAYTVDVRDRQITFLDTPGHEAFTTMRMRGAQATDIAILVVAADDGVMPQTIEAINHAKAANTTLVVAINKIDKAGANLDRVKQELANHEVISEEWGGSTVMVPVSAKTGEGIDELLDMLLLTADMMELRANPNRQAKGIVIEAKLDKNRGVLATLLVQRGTLRQGETLVTGSIVGNVRAMVDASGKALKEAGPSVPVEILGLPEVPEAGELFYAVEDERTARQLAEKRRAEQREASIHGSSRMTLDNLFSRLAAGEVKDLNIIVKADVVGSAEAVKQSLEKLSNDEVRVKVIHSAVGAITESDIRLADVGNAIVIGFNVRPVNQAAEMAKEAGVDVRLYRIIYNAIEDIQAAMKGMLDPEFEEQVTGHAEIRETFRVSSIGTIGGAYVTDGKIHRNSQVRLLRDGVIIVEGKLASLRRFKDDVKEVNQGYECGLSLERFNDLKVGDVVEAFEMKEVER